MMSRRHHRRRVYPSPIVQSASIYSPSLVSRALRPSAITIGLFHALGGPPSATSSQPGWSGKQIRGDYIKGYVAKVDWSDMQPSYAGQTFPDDNPVDAAIAESESLGLQLKVRVFFGANAPSWAKHIGGDPITLNEPTQSGVTFTIGRFWHPDYIEAYRLFWQQFAERYNSSSIIEVALSGPCTHWAEPDIRQSSDATNRATYAAAGYTLEADTAAQYAAIDAHVPLMKVSARGCNPNQNGLVTAVSAERTVAYENYVRDTLGYYGAVGNNSLQYPYPGTGQMATVYAGIDALGPPVYFQTATPARVGNLYQACLIGVAYGATMIELNGTTAQYTSSEVYGMTPAQFDEVNAALAANAATIGYPK